MPLANRFWKVGQNTPLTCVYMNGFEFGSTLHDMLSSGTGVNYLTSGSQHRLTTPIVYGGNRAMYTTGVLFSTELPRLKEFVIGSALYLVSAAAGFYIDFWNSAAGGANCSFRVNSAAGNILEFRRDTSTGPLLVATAPGSFPADTWNWVHGWINIDNASGFGHVRVGSWPNLIGTITGVDTQATANDYTDQIKIALNGGSHRIDDIIIFARTVYYSAGAGTVPIAGQTITGAGSGTTFRVDDVFDNGAGAGVLFVSSLSGTGITLAEGLANGIGWTATADNAIANDQASLWVPEQYLTISPVVSDVAAVWDDSTGASHYTEIDDTTDTATYISTDTVSQVNIHDVNVTLPAGGIVTALGVHAVARLAGASAVNNISLGLTDGVTPRDGEDSVLTGSWESHQYVFTNNPNTGAKFDSTEISNLNLRITSKA